MTAIETKSEVRNLKSEREIGPRLVELGEGDLEELSELGAGFWATGKLPGEFVPGVFVNSWRGLMAAGFGRIIGLVSEEGIVGALGFFLTPDPNDGVLKGSEAFWWVKPEARGAGVKLLVEFERLAREAGAQRLEMVHLLGLNDRLEVIYRRRGYEPVEKHYWKRV